MSELASIVIDAQHQCWNDRNPSALADIMLSSTDIHSPVLSANVIGNSNMESLCQYWLDSFENTSVTIDEVFEDSQRDVCILNTTITGQQKQSFVGVDNVGKKLKFECTDVYKFYKEKLISYKSNIDLFKTFMNKLLHVGIAKGINEINSQSLLTGTEKKYISLVLLGLIDKQIAYVFNRSISSVSTIRLRAFKKMGVNSKAQLMYLAIHENTLSNYINYAMQLIKENKPNYFKAYINPMCCS